MESETPSQGIKDIYKVNLDAGRTKVTDNLLIRFPSLKDEFSTETNKVAEKASIERSEPTKREVKNGKKSTR